MNHVPRVVFLASTCLAVSARSAAQEAQGPRDVAIIVYEGDELLDFAGPGEVFAAAHDARGPAFRVFTVSMAKKPVRSLGFVEITPQYALDDCPAPDIVVVPGGDVPDDDRALIEWVQRCSREGELVMSVCNGALVLGAAGLLDGLEATTHRGSLAGLAGRVPSAKVFTNRRFVDHGRVMTCAGISAGIDGALHVVERMLGKDQAWGVARYMEYDWRPDEIAKLHAQPGKTLADLPEARLGERVATVGLEAALAEYRALADAPGEQELNRAAYTLLRARRTEPALGLFRLTAAAFPASANAIDSLSEACELTGDTAGALEHARTALALLEKDAKLAPERAALLRNVLNSRLVRLGTGDQSALRYGCAPCGGGCDELRYLEPTRCPDCNMQLQLAADAPVAKSGE